jgi:sn-glycerol 3-phosphate transport system ATP-binding protein
MEENKLSSISLKNVTKRFGKELVIKNLDLNIKENSFTVLVGPSGCGQSTTLRMVFQNYALYPTMTVKENIEFGLKNKKVPPQERRELVAEISEIVGLTHYLDRKPGTLSGGQRQRVALARAMVKKPEVFLMDEPLSNLDAKLRAQMRIELIQLHKRLGTTFVYVTHDQVEAMSMGDTIVLMNNGTIMQESTPKEIYNNPQNLYTAQFVGTPPMNIINIPENRNYSLGFRPEKAEIASTKKETILQMNGKIITKEMLGAETVYQVQTKFGSVMVKTLDERFEDDSAINIALTEEHLYFFDQAGDRIYKNTPEYQECLKFKGDHSW